MSHFNQPLRRDAKFIKPSPELKQKVGYGGLNPEVLIQAQRLVDDAAHDFIPMAVQYLTALNESVRLAGSELKDSDSEALLSILIGPAMQLKGHGGMFGYESLSFVAGRLVQFLEVVREVNPDVLEITSSYYTAMNALVVSQVQDLNDPQTTHLYDALNSACNRYFEKYS